ncbi:MAG: zinc/iron-chelating domain-containing protein [Epsilonproteobacteria bacterium]|jgi:Fe-S-cluster containining protein|nr:zinc/iron-chelating domain-containing protein [Campylobacterota bacterium]NPA89142.1 YkgJ family cysteine cluster protein [Campylobacterota bacterium]
MIIQKEGFTFKFDPSKCEECGGKCCTGAPGYIWVSEEESEKIAHFLQMEPAEFRERYTRRAEGKISLIEYRLGVNNYACIFFDKKSGKCQIYPVRPIQCRTYPFWDIFKERWKEVARECPGILL